MAAYYMGLVLGGLYTKRVILRLGHIRAFSAFATLTAAVCLAYGFVAFPAALILSRLLNGFCIAGMTTSTESWLNDRSSNETRGRVLGFYMLVFYLAIAAGQTWVNLGPVGGSAHLNDRVDAYRAVADPHRHNPSGRAGPESFRAT
ncbi:MFS transporter [Sulfitobacter sp. CS16]|uniref:MFS transporter n=1 Tax=Sulfitobacter sp. CS16 TaxID=3368573 RepID=UPI003744C59C